MNRLWDQLANRFFKIFDRKVGKKGKRVSNSDEKSIKKEKLTQKMETNNTSF